MTEDLRISMIQSHIIWEDREENLGYYGELLRRVSGRTDLAVLPETFTTGFSMDVEKQADTMEGQTVPTIKEWDLQRTFRYRSISNPYTQGRRIHERKAMDT